MLIDLLDRVLTYLFATRVAKWVAVHMLHIPAEKCSLCYSRVRFAQFMLWLTARLDGTIWLREKRLTWKVRANPLPDGFSLASLKPLAAAPEPVVYLKESQLPSAANIKLPPYYLDMPFRDDVGVKK